MPPEMVSHALDTYEIKIIVNGNPSSRLKVEEGDLCLRSNENGVDLNRNWDMYWKKAENLRMAKA